MSNGAYIGEIKKLNNEENNNKEREEKKNRKIEVSLSELRKIGVDMLQYLDKICLENNINYFVYYGTLLGAIRHNGFIPWDDDIDIVLLRDDYEKLLEILKKENKTDYKLLDFSIQNDYFYPYAKLINTKTSVSESLFENIDNYGLFVDIFPLDNIPDDKDQLEKRLKKIKFYQKLSYWWAMDLSYEKNKAKKFIKIIIKKMVKLYGLKRIMRNYNKVSIKYNNIDTEYCSHNYPVPTCALYKKEYLKSPIRHKFENIEVNIPKEYDEILKEEYGDYMKLPPEKDRVLTHKMKYYWKD